MRGNEIASQLRISGILLIIISSVALLWGFSVSDTTNIVIACVLGITGFVFAICVKLDD